MSVQQFCLRWNNHQPNFISVCSSLLHNGTLVDVTLAAEGRQLQAHKIVLSACSSYFQTLFTSNPCQHPIVILKDVQYNDLKTMVDFMYYGEVNVSQEQLPHILKTAEMLKIKGLAEMPDAAASLTKSESKSSSEQTDQLQGGSGESLWGSTESQFQHHHHQHHPQHHLQAHHQQRRSPSPTSSGASPATRRKRLRKSSNSGSTERTSEEQSSVDGAQNINLSQMAQMSFGGTGTNLTQTLHTKIIKESSSTDTDTHPQDSSQESIDDTTSHQHHVQQIKPETDLGNVQQCLPLDISGPATPSEQEGPNVTCSQSQSSHSGVQWTVVDSNYPRFSLSSCQASISIGGDHSSEHGANASNGQHHQQQAQQHAINSSSGNGVVAANQQGHIQMHYQGSTYNPQMISVNNLVSNYSQNLSTPTSPTDSTMVQSVYSQGPTPTPSPVHQMGGGNSGTPNSNSQNQPSQSTQPAPQKRKRSVNPQSDENFIRALEAVRTGGIGFCKAARLYGVNNRTLWLEYKKRGYPISRPSIKNRIKLEPNISPPPPSTPTKEETNLENYEHINQPAINMQVPPSSETPTPIMCPPHAHPMGVMSFLDTRHMEFPASIHAMSRQRYADSGVNVNTAAMNLQGLNFNSI